jgi:DNA-directed RNA polymerase
MYDDGINWKRTRERAERQEHYRSKVGYAATGQFAALDREFNLIECVAKEIREQLKTSTDDWVWTLRGRNADDLAASSLNHLISSIVRGRKYVKIAIQLGRAAHRQLWAADLLKRSRRDYTKIRKKGRPDERMKAAYRAGYRSDEWTEEQAFNVGNWLIDCCTRALPDFFDTSQRTARDEVIIDIRESSKGLAAHLSQQLIGKNPVLIPTFEPPKPWTGWRDGGYHDKASRVPFIKGAAARNPKIKQAIVKAFKTGSMQQHVDGVNALQSVPYRLNDRVLDAVKVYYPQILEKEFRKDERKLRAKLARAIKRWKGGSFALPVLLILQRADPWFILGVAACQDRRAQSGIGRAEKKLEKRRRTFKQELQQFEYDLADAEYLKGAPFYVPLNCDFRGRIYPIPHFNYQRASHIRALFLFDRSLPIGKNLDPLKDYTAACWGHDIGKKRWPDRRAWCDGKSDLIEATAKLNDERWLKAKEPFMFMACCIELVAARDPNHKTHLPIAFDGASNVLVHFSALSRSDPLGIMGGVNPPLLTRSRIHMAAT